MYHCAVPTLYYIEELLLDMESIRVNHLKDKCNVNMLVIDLYCMDTIKLFRSDKLPLLHNQEDV